MQSSRFGQETEAYLRTYKTILEAMMKGMTEVKLTNSISYNFIVQMIPHHRAAIEMSDNVLQYTKNLRLQQIASNIVKEQTESIEHMQQIELGCETQANATRDVLLYQQKMRQIMQMMFHQMKNAKETDRINCDFMWEMLPHHEGAVRMSRNALQYCVSSDLKPILDSIITSQDRGIREMKNLQRQIGC